MGELLVALVNVHDVGSERDLSPCGRGNAIDDFALLERLLKRPVPCVINDASGLVVQEHVPGAIHVLDRERADSRVIAPRFAEADSVPSPCYLQDLLQNLEAVEGPLSAPAWIDELEVNVRRESVMTSQV